MDAMMPGFTRHFESRIPTYGPITCLNLLEKDGDPQGERLLSEAFEQHVVCIVMLAKGEGWVANGVY